MDAWPVKESKGTIFLKPDILEKRINQHMHFQPRCTLTRFNYRPEFERVLFSVILVKAYWRGQILKNLKGHLFEKSIWPHLLTKCQKIWASFCLAIFRDIFSRTITLSTSKLKFVEIWVLLFHFHWRFVSPQRHMANLMWGLHKMISAFVAEVLVSQVHSVELLGHCQLAPQGNCHKVGRDYVVLTGSYFYAFV